MAATNIVPAAWASPAPVQNPRRGRDAALPEGVVHLRKPLERNPAPSAYAEAVAFITAALPPAAYQRATQAARKAALDADATDEDRAQSRAALALLMGDWGHSRPD